MSTDGVRTGRCDEPLDILTPCLWRLGVIVGSHESQVMSSRSLEVNLCNLNCWERGSWDLSNDQGEPTASYRWIGWVWEITGWSSRLQETTDHFRGIYGIYINLIMRTPKDAKMWPVGLVTLGFEYWLCLELSVGIGLITSHGVLSPKSWAWHGCLPDTTFWSRDLGLVLRVGSSIKQIPTPNTSPEIHFCINQSRSDFNDYKLYFNGFLKLKSWDFAFMLGLANTSDTQDLEPNVNWS